MTAPTKNYKGPSFVKLDLGIRKEYLTAAMCKGEPTHERGSIHCYELRNSYRVFHPKVYDILRPEFMYWVNIPMRIIPHWDIFSTATLNVYAEPNDAKTSFWRINDNATPSNGGYNVVNNIYELEDLTYLDSFIANSGDSYLLNVSRVHTVDLARDKQRSMIQFGWTSKSYDEISALAQKHFPAT